MKTKTSNKLEVTMEKLAGRGEKALATFLMGGDPDPETSSQLLLACAAGGADILEIGVPFSDPLADGPVIQQAAARSLGHNTSIKDILQLVKSIKGEVEQPVVLLVYFNSIFNYGIREFAGDAPAAGVDAVVIPDLPFEEKEDVNNLFYENGIITIDFLAPTTGIRADQILRNSRGFVYCVAVTGVTGVRNTLAAGLKDMIQDARKFTQTPLLVGFGISGPPQAREVAGYADGVIVGSALVAEIANNTGNPAGMARAIREKTRAIKDAILTQQGCK